MEERGDGAENVLADTAAARATRAPPPGDTLEPEILLRKSPVPDEEIAEALAVLAPADPAGLLRTVTRGDVERLWFLFDFAW